MKETAVWECASLGEPKGEGGAGIHEAGVPDTAVAGRGVDRVAGVDPGDDRAGADSDPFQLESIVSHGHRHRLGSSWAKGSDCYKGGQRKG